MRLENSRPALLSRPVVFASWGLTVLLAAQTPLFSQQAVPPEMATQTAAPDFQLKVERNLVVVRVIVRDSQGHTQGSLTKDDFLLSDNGKPQTISHFSIEKAPSIPATPATGENAAEAKADLTPPSIARHFMALYFDDVHLDLQDIMTARTAAEKYLQEMLGPRDRASIYTSSGQVTLDFTSDQEALRRTLERLQPRPVFGQMAEECPSIGDYQAYLIVEQRDQMAIDIATEEGFECHCMNLPRQDWAQCRAQEQQTVLGLAQGALNQSEDTVEYSLRGVDQIIRRMGILPGERSLILISPGFMTATERQRVNDLVDRALKSNVVVGALDARGLWTDPHLSDPNARTLILRPDLDGERAQQLSQRDLWTQDVMNTLSRDTGGVFFHNNNDLVEGLRETSSLPEVSYILGFSPSNLKHDGRFHTIGIKLANGKGLNVQARRGYYAPSKVEDATAVAKEELREALFSQEDVNELPSDLRTQYFRLSQSQARLSVFTHVDVGSIHFEKQDGRNVDNLTILLAIFDQNGNMVVVKQKTVIFHLRDATLEKLRKSGLTAQTTFDVQPGNYLVRQVVRDDASTVMSGISRPVQVAF